MKKRMIAMVLSIVMVIGILPTTVFAADVVASGYCGGEGDGTNLTWNLDNAGVLTISGTGKMKDYRGATGTEPSPWSNYSNSIIKVDINEGVTTIGEGAFIYHNSIIEIVFPSTLEEIGIYSFAYCRKISTINLPNGLKKIQQHAFDNCLSLLYISIPETVTNISGDVFEDCPKLISAGPIGGGYNIEFAWDTKIPAYAFSGCFSLQYILIPSSIEKIGTECFTDCNKLLTAGPIGGNYNIEYGWTSEIPNIAFLGCPKLTSIYIPEYVDRIGDRAFSECYSLTDINVDSNNRTYTSVDGVLFSKDMTELVQYPSGKTGAYEIPQGVTSINSFAFGCTNQSGKCNKLTSITIPDSVTMIDYCAFQGCISIDKVEIPANVTHISYMAFNHCNNLSSAYFYGDAPATFDMTIGGIFDDCSDDFTMFYTKGKSGWTDSEAYDAEAGTWNGYKLAVWEDDSSDEDDNITYTRFGQYNGSTLNYVIDPVTGFGKNLMKTVTIDGITYDVADTCEQQSIYKPTNYLGDFYYIAYNLNEHNEVSAAEIMSGITCTLEGYDPITKVVNTDYTPIIPVGEDRTLPSGSFYVSDITESSFPSDQIGSWVGDRVRIYTVGEEIYKVVHITNGYGQLTRTDLTASPMIAEIDGVDYPVVAGDAGLAETIRAFPPGSQVSYTLYDGVIVEMASAEIPTLRVSINNPGNTYYVGEYICVLASDCLDTPSGTVRSMPINPVVSVSDEAILSLENTITSLPDIFSILGLGKGIGLEDDTFVCYTFRANAPGNVAIHIGDDSTNGRQLTIPIAISVDPHAGMRADDVEIYEWDLLGSEDYYNEIVNGMVISDFNCTRRDDGDSEYRFNVYNRSTLLGVAEVYDAAGKLIDIRIIDKASMPTDLKSTLAETWNGLIKPIFTDQDLFSFRGSGSKRTDFTSNPILVPEGGHVKITNSMAISVPCLLLNSMDITLEGIGFLKGSVDAAEFTSASAKQTLLRQVLETYLTPEGQQDILSQIAKSSLSSAGQAGIVAMFTDISGFAAEICDIVLASSHNTVVNTTIGMVQNTLESSGYGSALQVAFAATGIGNLIIQINQFSDSLSSDRAMTVYTPNDRQATVLAASHSVQLQAASVMGADTVLCADMIAVSDWSKPHTADSQSCLCYDLSLQTAGCEISLPSASTVTFPLPSGTWEDLRLYYLKPDTKRWEELSYTIEGAQIMAEVNSLGQFALVDGALLDDLPPDTRKYTIKFDANGGYCATKSIELKSAGTLPYFPTAYRSGNWKFVGWYNKPSGGLQYTEATNFGANATLYAHWIKTDSPEASNLYISTSIYKDEKVSALITNRTEAPSDGIFVAAVYDESGKMLGIKYTEMVLQSQKTLVLTIDAVNTDTIYMLRVFVMDSQSYQPIYPAWEMKFPERPQKIPCNRPKMTV